MMTKLCCSTFTLAVFAICFWLGHDVIVVVGCRISEFYCDNGQCVGLDKFCDGNRDCQDGSDETRFCSRCNRTYYGDRHKTYRIDIVKPALGKLPFVCALTFMAGGGDLGDIVELSFERFNIGQLEVAPFSASNRVASCLGSYMQILERNMDVDTAGRWCSPATSIAPVYYSESNNVTVVLTITDLGHLPFQFGLKFRYISKHDSVTRYGQSHAQYHRGEWVPNSVCDRIFQDCDSQPCKIQSPNFPGLYPRNVTCLLHVTQRTIPRGKHAFIVLKQPNEDKLSIKAGAGSGVGVGNPGSGASSNAGSGGRDIAFRPERKLMFGDDCVHDYVTVYDGSDTLSTALAKFCHGGVLAPIVSSGPEVVVEFRSAAADVLELHSFELDIEVIFFPENDIGLRILGHKCEFILDGDERSSGMIHSLRHLAAPNTSCSYIFRGGRHDVVWLYFVKYFVDGRTGYNGGGGGGGGGSMERLNGRDTATIQGELYDGNPTQLRSDYRDNTTLLTRFDDDHGLKLCVHARNFPNFVPLRPCKYPAESYLSSGPDLFLRYNFTNHFSLRYLHMEGRYEFVDTYQDGEPIGDTATAPSFECERIFRSTRRPEGTFSSPKNVFLYGRGGHSALRCSYTFIAQETETIRLSFRKLRTGNRKCKSLNDLQSNRLVCLHPGRSDASAEMIASGQLPLAELKVSQVLWNQIEVPVACICQLEHTFTVDVMSNVAHVNLTITEMTSLEDFDSFLFEGNYEFLSSVHCKGSDYVLDGVSGEVSASADRSDLRDGPTRIKCPWLLSADLNQFVHLRITGTSSLEMCNTDNRIVVFASDELEPVIVVCPMASRATDSGIPAAAATGSLGSTTSTGTEVGINSAGVQGSEVEVNTKSWNKTLFNPHWLHSNTLIVEFHASEPGRFHFKWTRGAKSQANKLLGRKSRSEECASKCVDGDDNDCMSSFNLWCDKTLQCAEHEGGACPSTPHFPWMYVGIGVGCGVLVTLILVTSLLHRLRETKAKKGKPISTEEYSMDGKEIDC